MKSDNLIFEQMEQKKLCPEFFPGNMVDDYIFVVYTHPRLND